MVGNFTVETPRSNSYQADNLQSLSGSCVNVIHGRQHLAILLAIIGVSSGAGAVWQWGRVRRTMAT